MADLPPLTVVISALTFLALQMIAFVYLQGPLRAISVGIAVFMELSWA